MNTALRYGLRATLLLLVWSVGVSQAATRPLETLRGPSKALRGTSVELRGPSAALRCETRKKAVVVKLDFRKHRRVLRHGWWAIEHGFPEFLTLQRSGADRRRDAAVNDPETGLDPRSDLDRDEYPPAVSTQGGAGSSVWYVDPSENRSAGAVMGNALRRYCDGQTFRYRRKPGPK